jgi:hypothetical protein
MPKKIKLFVLIFFTSILAFGQAETQKGKVHYGLELAGSLSYTGFNSHAAFSISYNKNTLLIGPRLVLSDMYLPSKGPWGIYLAYRRNVLESQKVSSFAGIDYHTTYMRPYNPQNISIRKYNAINELALSYGFMYNLSSRFSLGNSIGLGAYREKYYDVLEERKSTRIGFTKLIKLFVHYNF